MLHSTHSFFLFETFSFPAPQLASFFRFSAVNEAGEERSTVSEFQLQGNCPAVDTSPLMTGLDSIIIVHFFKFLFFFCFPQLQAHFALIMAPLSKGDELYYIVPGS